MTVTSKHTTGNYANNTSYVAVGSLVRRNVDGSFEHCSSSAALEDCNSEHVEAKGSSDRNTMVGGLVGDNAEDGVIVSSRFDGTMKVEVSANKSDR